MYQFRRILKMDLLNLFTNPMWWAAAIGLPLFLTLIMGFITRGSYGNAVTSYDYYGVSMLIFGALNNAALAANSFMENRIRKANLRLCNAPVPAFSIYFPKVLASFLFGAFCHTITGLGLSVIAGVNFGGSNTVFLWFLLLAVDFFAASLSVMLCCILKHEEAVNQLLTNLVTVTCLMGGAFFPIKGFGPMADAVSNVSPVTWIIAAAFSGIYDNRLSLLGVVCAALVGFSLLCTILSAEFFNREDYL